jgi:hypothetical protein
MKKKFPMSEKQTLTGIFIVAGTVVALVIFSVYFLVAPFFRHRDDMGDLYENSALPDESIRIGTITSRAFAERDGGDYRDVNLISIYEDVWAITRYYRTYYRNASSSYVEITGYVWRSNPQFHVFGFGVGDTWSEESERFFAEKNFAMEVVHSEASFYMFNHPNNAYFLRFGVLENEIYEILVSRVPLGP